MIKGILISILVVLTSGCMTNKQSAPYGFQWGLQPSDLKKLRLKETQCTGFQEGGALCSVVGSPEFHNKPFLLIFSRENNTLMLISAQGNASRDQMVILNEYDEINQRMFESYGLPKQTIERYKRDVFFLDKISDDEMTPFKRVYEQGDMRIMVGIVSNSHFRKIQDKKDIIYSVMVIHSLIPNKPQ